LKAFERFGDLERVSDGVSEHAVHADQQRRRANAKTLSSLHLTDRQTTFTPRLELEVNISGVPRISFREYNLD